MKFSEMRVLKHILVLFFLICLIPMMVYYFEFSGLDKISWILAGLLIIQFSFRKRLAFKPFYTSKLNIFTSKYSKEKTFDLQKDLLFDKVLEIVNEKRNYHLLDSDKETFRILIGTSLTAKSISENLYLDLVEIRGKTKIHFTSVAFQLYSWGKNEDNFTEFINNVEESFVI